jgi:hypothetical protein
MLIEYIPLIILTVLAAPLAFWCLSSDASSVLTTPPAKKASRTNQA